MIPIDTTLRASRAARLTARWRRAESKSLRAWMRAQWLIGANLRRKSRESVALVQSDKLSARLMASSRRQVAGLFTPAS